MRDDEELDALLREDANGGPPDDGFTERLLLRLPARRPRRRQQPRRAAQITQLAALTAALAAFGLLWSNLPAGAEAAGAPWVLLALVIAWTLPQLRLNPWR